MENQIKTVAPNARFVSIVKKKNGTIGINSDSFNHGIDANMFFSKRDIVYMFVVDGEILKIGQTQNTASKRIESYNSKRNNTSTEGRLMSDLLSRNKKVELYIVPAEGDFSFQGIQYPMNSVILEQMYINSYLSVYDRLPLLNKTSC